MSERPRVDASAVRRLVARHGTPMLVVDCDSVRRPHPRTDFNFIPRARVLTVTLRTGSRHAD